MDPRRLRRGGLTAASVSGRRSLFRRIARLCRRLAEELVFRGFLFGQLWRRAGWGLWPALAVSSLAFGYGHAEDAASLTEGLGLLAVTALGAAIFAWLYSRWGTLVAPLALHVLMNLSWGLWQVGDGALAGWVPFALQLTTVTLAIVLTLMADRRGWLAGPGS